jgi:uncharacterized membrane protein YqiK
LADASAKQDVIRAETEAAELAAHLAEQKLQSEVRKPADARAYETRTIAEADRDARISAAQAQARETELRAQADATQVKTIATAQAEATRATGEAEASAVRAKGLAAAEAAQAKALAEAEGIKARAAALAENQDAVVAQQLAEKWPEIVAAGAGAFSNVDHMIVMNGADGVSDLLTKALTMGGTGLGLAKQMLNAMSSDQGKDKAAENGKPAEPIAPTVIVEPPKPAQPAN